MPSLRVMTYNILMGGRHGRLLDQAVRQAAPDVLLVNESPKMPLLWRWQTQRLVARWGMTCVVGGRPAGSNVIAVGTAATVKSSAAIAVPQPLFHPRRGIASAQLKVRSSLVGVVACHLSLDQERRSTEAERVLEVADRLRGTVLVGGDLNEGARGPSWRRLRAAGYVDHGSDDWLTYPADEPTKRIDALLVRGAATVRHHGDPGVDEELLARASDHRPVLTVVDV